MRNGALTAVLREGGAGDSGTSALTINVWADKRIKLSFMRVGVRVASAYKT
jgi:hypothetical protein